MITGILWRQSEFFLQNWTCCLIHCLKSTNTNSFQIKKYPIFGSTLFLVIFLRSSEKFATFFTSVTFNCLPSKWFFIEPDIEVSSSFCFFTFEMTSSLCKNFFKHFWVVFTSLSSSTKKQDGQSSQFFCRTFKQFQTSKTQKFIFFCPHTF